MKPTIETLRRVIVLPGLVIASAMAVAAGLYATRAEVQPEAAETIAPSVRVVTVQAEGVQLRVHSQGTVQPRTESALIPEVAGRVEWISPSLVSGGVFEAGDPLLRIERADYEAGVAQADAALAQAEAEEANARFEFERRTSLRERNLVSQSDLEAADRRFRVAVAALTSARSGLERARRDLARTELRAPFDGVVRNENVDVGQFVNRGGAIGTVYARDYVEIRLPIADEQLAYLNLPLGVRGELPNELAPDVELTADFAGRSNRWLGDIVRTEGEIDPRSRMVHVVARVEASSPPLPVGLFVEAEILGNEVDDVITLPRSVLRDGNRVLVVDEGNRMHFRDVRPLRFYRDQVILASGLRHGERVCVSPIQTVIDGMLVVPQET